MEFATACDFRRSGSEPGLEAEGEKLQPGYCLRIWGNRGLPARGMLTPPSSQGFLDQAKPLLASSELPPPPKGSLWHAAQRAGLEQVPGLSGGPRRPWFGGCWAWCSLPWGERPVTMQAKWGIWSAAISDSALWLTGLCFDHSSCVQKAFEGLSAFSLLSLCWDFSL